jgi:hypothetical protein
MTDLELDQSTAYPSALAHQSKFLVGDDFFGTQSVGFYSESLNEKLTSESSPEEEFHKAAAKQDENASFQQYRQETGGVLSGLKDALNGEKGQDDSRELLSSVSSASVSLGLFSAAGSVESKSSAPASSRGPLQQQPASEVDVPEIPVGGRNGFGDAAVGGSFRASSGDQNGCGGSCSSSHPSSSRNTPVGKIPDERPPTSTADAGGLPSDGDKRIQLDSNSKRCHSATAFRASSPPFVEGAVDRMYFSAACSVQSCASSRSTTPANRQESSRKSPSVGVRE